MVDVSVVERSSLLTTRILAPNPSLMTLDGTNTYVIQAPGAASAVIVDPGPAIEEHLDRIAAHVPIALILLTHHHLDHTESAVALAAQVGAPVRAMDAALCVDAPPLRDGEQILAAGTRIHVIATPGHTADSVCFALPDDEPAEATKSNAASSARGSILTGDTILGRGTTILARPDGSLRDYLRSLDLLASLPTDPLVLPAHGPSLPGLTAIAREYAEHRRRRLTQVTDALEALGLEPSLNEETVARVTDAVYPHIHPDVRFAAEASTYSQLEFLAEA